MKEGIEPYGYADFTYRVLIDPLQAGYANRIINVEMENALTGEIYYASQEISIPKPATVTIVGGDDHTIHSEAYMALTIDNKYWKQQPAFGYNDTLEFLVEAENTGYVHPIHNLKLQYEFIVDGEVKAKGLVDLGIETLGIDKRAQKWVSLPVPAVGNPSGFYVIFFTLKGSYKDGYTKTVLSNEVPKGIHMTGVREDGVCAWNTASRAKSITIKRTIR